MRAGRWLTYFSFALAACSDAAADEPRRVLDMTRAFDTPREAGAARDPAAPREPAAASVPDPPPLATPSQWAIALKWDRGDVWLVSADRRELPAPRETARAMGRFALELFEGPALLERVRFNFPLLGLADDLEGDSNKAFSLSRTLKTEVAVYFPVTTRGTRFELVDRATRRRWSIPWPPP